MQCHSSSGLLLVSGPEVQELRTLFNNTLLWNRAHNIFLSYWIYRMQLGQCQYSDNTQFNYWQWQKIIPFSEISRLNLAPTQLSIQWIPVLAPGVYQPRHKLDHLPHLVPQLGTNEWISISAHPVCIYGTYKDSLTLNLLYKSYTTNSTRGIQWSCDCISCWYALILYTEHII